MDPTDPGAAFLATLTASDTAQTIRALAGIDHRSIEVSLALTRAYLEDEHLAEAADELRAAARESPNDWRIDWYRGLIALASGGCAARPRLFRRRLLGAAGRDRAASGAWPRASNSRATGRAPLGCTNGSGGSTVSM